MTPFGEIPYTFSFTSPEDFSTSKNPGGPLKSVSTSHPSGPLQTATLPHDQTLSSLDTNATGMSTGSSTGSAASSLKHLSSQTPTAAHSTDNGTNASLTSVAIPSKTGVSFAQAKRHSVASLAGIITGTISGVVLTVAFIALWRRRRKSRLAREPRGHTPLIDIENENKPPAIFDELEADYRTQHQPHSVAEPGRLPDVLALSHSEPTDTRNLVNARRVSLSHVDLGEYHLQSSEEKHIEAESGGQPAGQAETTQEQTDKHRSPTPMGVNIAAESVVLTVPDPLQDVVRAQQEWMLEKAAARHDQHNAEGDATTSVAAPGVASTPGAPTIPEPEDYQALRAEVLLLRQRMQQIEEGRDREIVIDDDELPPAYEGRSIPS